MTGPTGHLLPATNHTLLLTDSPHPLPCNRHPNTRLRSLKRSHSQRPHIQLRQPAQSLFFTLVHNVHFLYLSVYKIRNYSDINKFIFSKLTKLIRTTEHKKAAAKPLPNVVYIYIRYRPHERGRTFHSPLPPGRKFKSRPWWFRVSKAGRSIGPPTLPFPTDPDAGSRL